VTLPNTPATIDSDYRGELKVALMNLGQEAFEVTRGMRIAQIVVGRVEPAEFRTVENLPSTERGAGGFGSTGLQT
jgi:dUTP pyrophosphatase